MRKERKTGAYGNGKRVEKRERELLECDGWRERKKK